MLFSYDPHGTNEERVTEQPVHWTYRLFQTECCVNNRLINCKASLKIQSCYNLYLHYCEYSCALSLSDMTGKSKFKDRVAREFEETYVINRADAACVVKLCHITCHWVSFPGSAPSISSRVHLTTYMFVVAINSEAIFCVVLCILSFGLFPSCCPFSVLFSLSLSREFAHALHFSGPAGGVNMQWGFSYICGVCAP